MKLIVVFGLLVVISIVSYLGFSSHSTDKSPVEVVKRYCSKSRSGLFEDLTKYVTDPPDIYYSRLLKREGVETEVESKASDSSAGQDSISFTLPNSKNNVVARRLILEAVPQLIHTNQENLISINQTWLNGRECKVRVEMGSEQSTNYKSKRDFFLYLEDDGWKIFRVAAPSTYDRYGQP